MTYKHCNSVRMMGSRGYLTDLQYCLLSLQVHSIYRDPSIGNAVNIVVVNIVELGNELVSVNRTPTLAKLNSTAEETILFLPRIF